MTADMKIYKQTKVLSTSNTFFRHAHPRVGILKISRNFSTEISVLIYPIPPH